MRYPAKSPAEGVGSLLQLVGAEVCQLAALDVVPDRFGGIQVRRVTGKPLDLEPVPLTRQKLFHQFTAVRRQVVPNQDHLGAPDKALQLLQERDQTLGVETIRFGPGEQPRLPTVPTEAERGRHGGFAPVIPARPQDRRFPAGRPGSADGGLLGESGLVLEEDPGPLLRSVFFSSGQRTVFQ